MESTADGVTVKIGAFTLRYNAIKYSLGTRRDLRGG